METVSVRSLLSLSHLLAVYTDSCIVKNRTTHVVLFGINAAHLAYLVASWILAHLLLINKDCLVRLKLFQLCTQFLLTH